MYRILILIFLFSSNHAIAQFSASWVQIETDTNNTGYNRIEDMFIDSNGNIYVNGSLDTLSTIAPIIISYDSSGTERWRRTINGQQYNFSFNWRMLNRPNGNIICAGHYEDNSGTNNMIYLEFNEAGDSVGGGIMNAPGFATGDDLYDACLDANGNLYLAGQIRSGNEFPAAVSRFDSSGTLNWLSSYPILTGWSSSAVRGIEMHKDSGMYCLTFNFTGFGSLLYCDTAGNYLWQTTLPLSLNDYHTALAVDASGDAIAGGHLNQGFGIVKVNAVGDTLWSREFSYPGLSAAGGQVVNIKCDSAGNIYTLGIFAGTPLYSMVSKFDAAGTMLWSDTIRGYNHIYGMNKDYFQVEDGIISVATVAGGSWLYRYNLSGQRLTDQALILPGVNMPEVNSIRYHNGSIYLAGNSYAGFNIRRGFTARLDDLSNFISSVNDDLNFSVYPNPVTNIFHVQLKKSPLTPIDYTIFNLSGKVLRKGCVRDNSKNIYLHGIDDGIYIIELNDSGKLSRRKFVVLK